MVSTTYLDIFIGDKDEHALYQTEYDTTCELLSKNASIYGLPSSPADLDEEQKDILKDLRADVTLTIVF